ncbi:MAG TPA: carbohydrate ABC transporter permease [Actinomycetota bacterium]|nr:carbohydrate ABC transporter permease [Actinomycetota bacterium]
MSLHARALRRRVGGRIALYALVLLFAAQAAVPFAWGLITTFKANPDLYNRDNNPFLFNEPPTLDHVQFLFRGTAFGTFVGNTVVVALCVVAITLLVAIPAAYSLGRLSLRRGGAVAIAIFFVYLIPPSLLFISLSPVVANLGLQDSRWSLVVVYPTITIPVSVWLLTGFFKSIPRDMEEQAMVDGCSRMGAFFRMVLPAAVPGLIAVVVFASTLSASEFIYALAFVSQTSQKTVSVGVPTELVRGDIFFWQALQAATLVVAIPIALVFNLFLKRFISGFTMGAVKG